LVVGKASLTSDWRSGFIVSDRLLFVQQLFAATSADSQL
jgi:hypothetical protein